MSGKRNGKISTFLFIVTLTFDNLHLSFSLSEVIKLKTLFGLPAFRDNVESEYHVNARQTLRTRGSVMPRPARSALPQQRSWIAGLSPPTLHRSSVPKQLADPDTYEQRASEVSLKFGIGSEQNTKDSGRHRASAYQADYPGFKEINKGNIFGPSFEDSRPTPSSAWQAMRPLVQCHDTTMTLTASGQGFSQLFLEREGDFPISVFHLPPNCGYSVTASRNGLVLEAPYDGCYMTKQNGSYVLPMLWWDSPLRLSCPMQKSPPSPALTLSRPWALCSPYGVSVHVYGTDEEIPSLGTIVEDNWEPLVSPKCAYRTEAPLGNLLFYIPLNAPCLQAQEGLHLRVLKDYQEFSLSCQDLSFLPPLVHIPPHTPPLSPVDPITPAPVPTTASPPTPQSMTRGQVIWPPSSLNYPHPGPRFPHLPLVYPPGPQPKSHSQPSPDVAPGPPAQFPHLYSGPGQQPLSPHPPPSPPQPPAVEQTSGPSVDPVNQSPKWPPRQGFYYGYEPYMPLYGSQVPHKAPSPSDQSTTARPPKAPPHTPHMAPYDQQYNPQQSYHPLHTFSQVPQSPVSIVHPAFPAPPRQLFVPRQPLSYSQYYPYWSVFTPRSFSDGSPPLPSQPPTTPTTPSPTLRTTRSKGPSGPDHRPPASLCPPNTRPFCGCHPDAPHIPPTPAPPYPPQHTTPMTPGSQPFPSPAPPTSTSKLVRSLGPQPPRLQCYSERMTAFLPSPHPDSIQIRALTADFKKAWLPLSSVSPLCKFKLSLTKEPGLMFESPIPACHSQQKTPTTLSLRLRFWDVILSRKRILEFQCPYSRPLPGTAVADGPPVPPDSPAASLPPPTPRPRHAKPDLPREMLGLRAIAAQGCNLPEDQRLPCGTSALTQPQCLSLGCCFNTRPPACHYPMDECTLDHHFVFSVPASLTYPPLSPALLAAPGHPSCTPQRVTADYALFLIPMDSCGALRMVIGKTVIYILEIVNKVESITLDYGTITRDSPARILVECRYKPGPPLVTAGYMTKIPSLGPGLQGQGVIGVQLRIAKDAHYSSFHAQYHAPLRTLLRQPLYLEVRLVNPPDLQVVLLVHYCVAYPRSGATMWVLLYKECPNPLDPAPHNVVLPSPESQTRRFTITTFQFLQKGKTYDLDQEVYFMCSTEACVPQDRPCLEGCLGQ
ncbi:unnamed protein product [Gadus morhua 'NCC']